MASHLFSATNMAVVLGISDTKVLHKYIHTMDLGPAFPRGPVRDFTECGVCPALHHDLKII